MPASLSAFDLDRFEESFDDPFAANDAASKAATAYDAPLWQRNADALVVQPQPQPQPQPQLQTRALSVSSDAAERELLTQLQHSRTVIESLRKQVATAAGQLAETRRQLSLARTERMQLANAPPPSPEQLPPSAVAAAAEAERLELALAASNARADELNERLVSANAAVERRKSEIDELRAQSVSIQERMLREAISLSRESDEERRTLQLEFSQSVANSIDFEAQKQAMQQFAKAEASANAMRIKELREENQRLHAVNADLDGKLGHEAAFAQRSSGELRAELDAAQAALEVLRRQAEHEVGGLRNLLEEAKGNERRIRAVAEAEKGGAAELVASLQEEVRAAKNRSQAGASSAELKGQKLTTELTEVKADLEATRKEVTEANTQMRLQQHRFEDQKTDYELQLRQKEREIERVQAQAREDATHFELAIETLRQQVGGAHSRSSQQTSRSAGQRDPSPSGGGPEPPEGVEPAKRPVRRSSMTALAEAGKKWRLFGGGAAEAP